MTAAVFEERSDPGQMASALLSAAVHLLLLVVLVLGVSWQSRPPEPIAVELWEPLPATVAEAPKPPPEPPAPVVAKPEPVLPKPEIAEKAPPPRPVPKPVPKVEPRPKPEPPKAVAKPPKDAAKPPKDAAKPRDEEAQRQIREQLQREQAALAIDRERQHIRELLARDAAASSGKAKAEWVDRIRAKIRGNIVLPPDLQGNPEAIFLVVQLPTGEVLNTRLVKSSGHRGYDEAVERAILKSSPLPRPDKAEFFDRELRLTFRPRD
jgi:colicin import membrane protein